MEISGRHTKDGKVGWFCTRCMGQNHKGFRSDTYKLHVNTKAHMENFMIPRMSYSESLENKIGILEGTIESKDREIEMLKSKYELLKEQIETIKDKTRKETIEELKGFVTPPKSSKQVKAEEEQKEKAVVPQAPTAKELKDPAQYLKKEYIDKGVEMLDMQSELEDALAIEAESILDCKSECMGSEIIRVAKYFIDKQSLFWMGKQFWIYDGNMVNSECIDISFSTISQEKVTTHGKPLEEILSMLINQRCRITHAKRLKPLESGDIYQARKTIASMCLKIE
jgi:hypothetical protein